MVTEGGYRRWLRAVVTRGGYTRWLRTSPTSVFKKPEVDLLVRIEPRPTRSSPTVATG